MKQAALSQPEVTVLVKQVIFQMPGKAILATSSSQAVITCKQSPTQPVAVKPRIDTTGEGKMKYVNKKAVRTSQIKTLEESGPEDWVWMTNRVAGASLKLVYAHVFQPHHQHRPAWHQLCIDCYAAAQYTGKWQEVCKRCVACWHVISMHDSPLVTTSRIPEEQRV